MLKSLYDAASSGQLDSPFYAKCDGLKVNDNREIQAAAVAEGMYKQYSL